MAPATTHAATPLTPERTASRACSTMSPLRWCRSLFGHPTRLLVAGLAEASGPDPEETTP